MHQISFSFNTSSLNPLSSPSTSLLPLTVYHMERATESWWIYTVWWINLFDCNSTTTFFTMLFIRGDNTGTLYCSIYLTSTPKTGNDGELAVSLNALSEQAKCGARKWPVYHKHICTLEFIILKQERLSHRLQHCIYYLVIKSMVNKMH